MLRISDVVASAYATYRRTAELPLPKSEANKWRVGLLMEWAA